MVVMVSTRKEASTEAKTVGWERTSNCSLMTAVKKKLGMLQVRSPTGICRPVSLMHHRVRKASQRTSWSMGLGPQKLTEMFSAFVAMFHLLTAPLPFSKMLPKEGVTMYMDAKGASTVPLNPCSSYSK